MFKVNPGLLAQFQIVKPLHGVNPRTIMGQSNWDKLRKQVYAENDFHCMGCGVHKKDALYHQWLECHEDCEVNFKECQYTIRGFVPLCHACHNFIHLGRLEMMVQK